MTDLSRWKHTRGKRETFLFIKNQFLENNKVAINSEDNIDTICDI